MYSLRIRVRSDDIDVSNRFDRSVVETGLAFTGGAIQIAYVGVFLVFGALAILTGVAMSPAVANRFPGYPRLFGGRQSARSIHFLTMIGFVGFLVVHVTLVIMTEFARNMNHIVMGTDDMDTSGMIWGFVGIGVIGSWIVAHDLSWKYPRALQRAVNRVTYPMQLITLNRLKSHQRYRDPRTKLRRWFSHEPEKWREFRRRYRRELDSRPEAWQPIVTAARRGPVTLVYSSHDTEHNNAVALQQYLEARIHRPSKAVGANTPAGRGSVCSSAIGDQVLRCRQISSQHRGGNAS
jgi:hypothetical protein